jgi:hypothetical protein
MSAAASVHKLPLKISTDDKAKLVLPPVPPHHDRQRLAEWLTVAFALDAQHPIIDGARQGVDGPEGQVELKRLDARSIRFEPASRINQPNKLIETLSWSTLPTDGALLAYKAEHCRQIAHVTRMLCGLSGLVTATDEAASIVGSYLNIADPIEGRTTHGTGRQRFEAAQALQRDPDEHTGILVGPHRYLIDADTGELVIRVADLGTAARRFVGGSLARGWLDARMAAMGWSRVRIDGHALPGRAGRHGPHARTDVYRGHLPHERGWVTT